MAWPFEGLHSLYGPQGDGWQGSIGGRYSTKDG